MFGFSKKEKNIELQNRFEKSIISYLNNEADECISIFVPNFTSEEYMKIIEAIGKESTEALSRFPKNEAVIIISKLQLLIPYNEDVRQEMLGSVIVLMGLRVASAIDNEDILDENKDPFLLKLKEILNELTLIQTNIFGK